MTANELAHILAPQVREAAERLKETVLTDLQPIQRVFVKALWGLAMREGVPIATRIVIEFLIAKYRTDLEPTIGEFVNTLIKSIDEEKTPELKVLRDILDVFHTPTTEFHQVVQDCLNPSLVHEDLHYEDGLVAN